MVFVPDIATKFPSVGQCIYCGSRIYSAKEPHRKLGDEHIIPLSLNGDLILQDASCHACEGRINSYEQPITRQTLGPLRYALRLDTRNPQERPESALRDVRMIDGTETQISVPFHCTPALILLPILPPPQILTDAASTPRPLEYRQAQTRLVSPPGLETHNWAVANGVDGIKPIEASFRADRWLLLLAKIAHSFAAARFPADRKEMNLLNDIVRKEPGALPANYYVGGIEEMEPPTEHLHHIRLGRADTETDRITLVIIRLFACFAMPTYCVAVSKHPLANIER
jgi:hypothetical protein